MDDWKLGRGYVPGAIGRVAEMHADYYHRHWGFGLYFEVKVATALSEFLLRYDETRDGFWTVSRGGRVEGSIAIDGLKALETGAHLRWFILSEALRGQGLGRALLQGALAFCRERRYPRVTLWTFEGLAPARHLYETAGFRRVAQFPGAQWGVTVEEQRFDLDLTYPAPAP